MALQYTTSFSISCSVAYTPFTRTCKRVKPCEKGNIRKVRIVCGDWCDSQWLKGELSAGILYCNPTVLQFYYTIVC